MATIIKAPGEMDLYGKKSLFLAGSIEMGKAENWQERVEKELAGEDALILNPRRDDWDSSWEQTIANDNFREQVEWELFGLEHCDIVAMYFAPDTMAPITLLEFGMYAMSGKLSVCSPPGFWRRGNLEVVCDRYGIHLYSDFDQWIDDLISRLMVIIPKGANPNIEIEFQ
jgi:hypothetical protein